MAHISVLVVTDVADPEAVQVKLEPYGTYTADHGFSRYLSFVDRHEEVEAAWRAETQKQMKSPSGELFPQYYTIFWRAPSEAERSQIDAQRRAHPEARAGAVGPLLWNLNARDVAEIYDPPADYTLVDVPMCEIMPDIADYAAAFFEGCELRGGRVGEMRNLNAKWDWWARGGRFEGMLPTAAGPATSALRRDCRFDDALAAPNARAGAVYDQAQRILGGRGWTSFAALRAGLPAPAARDERVLTQRREAERAYRAQAPIRDLQDAMRGDAQFYIAEADIDLLKHPKPRFIAAQNLHEIATGAVIDAEWRQYFGRSWADAPFDPDAITWREAWWAAVKAIPGDKTLTIVDCHYG